MLNEKLIADIARELEIARKIQDSSKEKEYLELLKATEEFMEMANQCLLLETTTKKMQLKLKAIIDKALIDNAAQMMTLQKFESLLRIAKSWGVLTDSTQIISMHRARIQYDEQQRSNRIKSWDKRQS